MQAKRIHQFKAVFIVHFHGARFLIQENAHVAQIHRPQASHLETAASIEELDEGEWISGEIVPGYLIRPAFGNH
jgi:hypothetical protein